MISLNGVDYIRKDDVDKFYTRKDEVAVDRMVVEAWLEKMESPHHFVHLVAESAKKHILKNGYAMVSDMINPDDRDFKVNKLLMIANADLL